MTSSGKRAFRMAAHAGNSAVGTFLGSFDKVLAIGLALLLLFLRGKMVVADSMGLTIQTPVMNVLEMGNGLSYADVDAVNGVGYETSAAGELQGRYFSFNSILDFMEIVDDYGIGTSPLIRGVTGLVALLVDLMTDPEMIGFVTGRIVRFVSDHFFDLEGMLDTLDSIIETLKEGPTAESVGYAFGQFLASLRNMLGGLIVWV